jgi:hypothetical protein
MNQRNPRPMAAVLVVVVVRRSNQDVASRLHRLRLQLLQAAAAGLVGSAPGAAKKWPYLMCRDRRPRSGWQTERVPRKTQRKTQPVAAALVVAAAAVRRSNRNVASRLRCQRLRLLQEAATGLLGSAPEAAGSWPYPMLRNGRQHSGLQTVPDLPNLLR